MKVPRKVFAKTQTLNCDQDNEPFSCNQSIASLIRLFDRNEVPQNNIICIPKKLFQNKTK